MSIFIRDAPEIVDIVSILAAAAERLHSDQSLWRDHAEDAGAGSVPFGVKNRDLWHSGRLWANPPSSAGRVLLASLPGPEGVSALSGKAPFSQV